MASSTNAMDWNQLKPSILQHLANGKTQQQIRQGLAEDPFRVSISKSQLETQLKHWKYRNSLHEQEWKVVCHRINKRRKAGKPASQVLVNGFIFNERKVSNAMKRYYKRPQFRPPLRKLFIQNLESDVMFTGNSVSPQIPPELSHHIIEVRTPPPRHQSLQSQTFTVAVEKPRQGSFGPYLNSAGRVWQRTAQWKQVELLRGQSAAPLFLPVYPQVIMIREAFKPFGRQTPVSRTHQGWQMSAPHSCNERLFPAGTWYMSTDSHNSVSFQRFKAQRSYGGPHTHTNVVKKLVDLVYGLSNQSLDDDGRQTLVSMLKSPTWDSALPQLRKFLTLIDWKIVQAAAEGLLKESIHTCHHRMLELSLGLGADPTQHIRYYCMHEDRHVLSTPLVALCNQLSLGFWDHRKPSAEKMIFSLLKRDPCVPNSTLLWLIMAGCHGIAEAVIRIHSQRVLDFSVPVSDLEGDCWVIFDTYDSVTPLLAACSYPIRSAEKLSLVRCLLDRKVKANLETMIAAAGTCDVEVISLLHKHWTPVNGFINKIGSPLSSVCQAATRSPETHSEYMPAMQLLLNLGASPNIPKDMDLDRRKFSPLHILAVAEEHPRLKEALDLLIRHGVHIDNHVYAVEQFTHTEGSTDRGEYGALAETALECAIESSRWISAIQLLSAGCELTGREILFITSTRHRRRELPKKLGQERFRQFIDALLARAPTQACALHWSGLTILQRAIQNEHEEMILSLFAFGVTPTPSDFLYMLRNRTKDKANVCSLSSTIQMNLAVIARLSEPPITDIPTIRLILAYACPEVVRRILHHCPDFYDSEGLCFVIARLVSKDKTSYSGFPYQAYDAEEDQQPNSLIVDDLHAFISRRTIFNRHEDWESTAVTMLARAGRSDLLGILIESSQEELRSHGLIPSLLLKKCLIGARDTSWPSGSMVNDWNWGLLGVWIKYCRMDNPNIRCSPLTAAAMVVPETAAEEVFDLLLALNYQPDGWTVLIASCQGRLSILQRLKRLKCWPYIVSHEDRPDWCPTALQTAVYNAHVSTVEFLLGTEAMVNTLDLSPHRPFCFSLPGNPDSGSSGTMLPRTALQHAVEKENMELFSVLIRAGAYVNAPAAMDSGATALQIASIKGSIPMMEYLISWGADPYAAGATYDGRTALEGAAEHGRKDAVELLLAISESTACQDCEQLIKAVFYAEWNAQQVVAGILRERLLPLLSSEGEKILRMFSEKWKSSTGRSESFHLHEIEAWAKTFDDIPKSLRAYEGDTTSGVIWEENDTPKPLREYEGDITSGVAYEENDTPKSLRAHEGDTTSGVTYEDTDIENPTAVLENGVWGFQEWEIGIEGYGELDIHQIGGADLYDGDVTPGFTFQVDNTALVDYQPSFEGNGVDDTLFDNFSSDDSFSFLL